MFWVRASGEKDSWRQYKDQIKKVVIEEGITEIGKDVFKECVHLESITIPESVSVIGISAFEHCVSLKNIYLPEGVEEICSNAFAKCYNLESVSIPGSVKKIDSTAFTDCGGFDYIYIYWTNDHMYDRLRKGADFYLKVQRGSYGETFAKEKELSYDNGGGIVPGWKASLFLKMDQVVEKCIKPEMTDKEKAKALHDWVVYNSYYGAPISIDKLSGGVCQNYAQSYSYLLRRVHIANTIIHGYTTGSAMSHCWNLVRIDGQWYHVDTTFDDPAGEKANRSGNERSKYFMLTDEQMRQDHIWDEKEPDEYNNLFIPQPEEKWLKHIPECPFCGTAEGMYPFLSYMLENTERVRYLCDRCLKTVEIEGK